MRIEVNAFTLCAALLVAQVPMGSTPASAQDEPSQPPVTEPKGDAEILGPADPVAIDEPPRQWGADQWVPSFAVISGVTVQNWEATTLTAMFSYPQGSTAAVPPQLIRLPQRGRTRDVSPFVGGNFELMTPELPLPASPRIFFGFDLAAGFSTDRKVAREGDPGLLVSPIPLASQGSAIFIGSTALGQGSQTTARMKNSFYGANVGVAFPVEFLGQALRIKPSVAWMRHVVDINGLSVDAQCPSTSAGVVPNPDFPNTRPRNFSLIKGGCDAGDSSDPRTNFEGFFRGGPLGVRVAADVTKRFDSIGPGLDVEMDAFRLGPMVASIFASGRIFSVLGPRSVRFRGTLQSPINLDPTASAAQNLSNLVNQVTLGALAVMPSFGTPFPSGDPANPGLVDCTTPNANPNFCTPFTAFPNNDFVTTDYGFEVDQWMYRVGLGLRLSWVGWN